MGTKYGKSDRVLLATVVLLHLFISVVHGRAHEGAAVSLSSAGTVFVFAIILAGPLIGLGVTWLAAQPGAWIVAVTMGASFLFGLINHFVRASPDHVSHVVGDWQPLFVTTALLLAVTEAFGAGLAVRVALKGRGMS